MFKAWSLRWRHGRDPAQVRLLTWASLRWVIRHRAWTPFYLIRYWRVFVLRLRRPQIVLQGMVFLGKGVQLDARPGYGRLILGRWVHIGDVTRLRAHEGTLRVGDKVVVGSDTTINCYLDVEIRPATLISDWVYICDFDHVTAELAVPIKDQGLVKTPVRIGSGCWIGVKTTVLRGTVLGDGSVLAAHAVARGIYPDQAIIAGVPGRVVRDRGAMYEQDAGRRAALADMARKHDLTAQAARGQSPSEPAMQSPSEPAMQSPSEPANGHHV